MTVCCVAMQTHEEAMAELVSSEVTSHRQLPLRLYQVAQHVQLYMYIVYMGSTCIIIHVYGDHFSDVDFTS